MKESVQKMSEARKGKPASNRVSVHKISIETGDVVATYSSIREAEESCHSKTLGPNICSVLKGKRKSAGNFYWKYVDENDL